MSNRILHLSRPILARFLSTGELSPALEKHLESCVQCQNMIEEKLDDDLEKVLDHAAELMVRRRSKSQSNTILV